MKYVFGFNVGVELYKKFPTIQIYVQDRLIDEFDLDENDLYKNVVPEKDRYVMYTHLGRESRSDSIPDGDNKYFSTTLRCYTINGEYLKDHIKIVIKNQDSNYTNGFMTKSTLVYFSNVFLIPLKFLENIDQLKHIYDQYLLALNCYRNYDQHGLDNKEFKKKYNMSKTEKIKNNSVPELKKIIHLDLKDNEYALEGWPTTNSTYINGKRVQDVSLRKFGGDTTLQFNIHNRLRFKALENIILTVKDEEEGYKEYIRAKSVDLSDNDKIYIILAKSFMHLSLAHLNKYSYNENK